MYRLNLTKKQEEILGKRHCRTCDKTKPVEGGRWLNSKYEQFGLEDKR